MCFNGNMTNAQRTNRALTLQMLPKAKLIEMAKATVRSDGITAHYVSKGGSKADIAWAIVAVEESNERNA